MHKHLIDWYRNVHIHPDPAVVERRWNAAAKYAEKISRASICQLLRVFLFPALDPTDKEQLEQALLEIDREFPISGNDQELRLISGVVMTVTFGESSRIADAFALGLRAATALGRHLDPAQPEILQVAVRYLAEEAENERPSGFGAEATSSEATFKADLHKLSTATPEAANAIRDGLLKEIINAIEHNQEVSDRQLRRLSEESAVLWWIINDYSDCLQKERASLSKLDYALAVAVEASERTHLLPPPNSMQALLRRALMPCRSKPAGPYSLEQLLAATQSSWRAPFIRQLRLANCNALLPIITGLAKTEEFDNATAAAQVIPKLCPGIDTNMSFQAEDVAWAAYAEIIFLNALAKVDEG